MMMDDTQIVISFLYASRPAQQIRILAELNGCKQDLIKEILMRHERSAKKLKNTKSIKMYDWDLALVLLKHGHSDSKIAKEIGANRSSVFSWRSRNGYAAGRIQKGNMS